MTSPFQCVIDTNVAIKQFIDDPLMDKVNQLFTHLAKSARAQFYVPDLFYIECANVILKYVRANQASTEQVALSLADFKALRMQSVPDKTLMLEAFEVSAEYNISAYDSSHAVLSSRVCAPLLTLDKRLFNAMKSSSYDVQLFIDFSILPHSS